MLVAEREAKGRPISSADAQIAAICHAHDAVLATRNGKDFEATGVPIIDPWTAE
jgi:predicted nucleic acid-binding protein